MSHNQVDLLFGIQIQVQTLEHGKCLEGLCSVKQISELDILDA